MDLLIIINYTHDFKIFGFVRRASDAFIYFKSSLKLPPSTCSKSANKPGVVKLSCTVSYKRVPVTCTEQAVILF